MTLPRLVSALLAVSTIAGAAHAAAAERRFSVDGFDRVSASGSEDVTIITGKTASVIATGPQARLNKLEIKVDGTTLRIGHASGSSWNMSWGDRDQVRIVVTMPQLHGIRGSGSGDITADSGTGPAFEAILAGSGDMKISRIDSPAVTLRTAGSGDITATGQCGSAKVSISGSGDMNLGELACTDIEIGISGSGDVAARATGTAAVRISGSGDVTVAGGARCTSRTSGSGSVSCG